MKCFSVQPQGEGDPAVACVERFVLLGLCGGREAKALPAPSGSRTPPARWEVPGARGPFYPVLRVECFSPHVASIRTESWFTVSDLTLNQKFPTSLSHF